MVGISYIDYYLPKEELTIERFVETCDDKYFPKEYSTKEEYALFLSTYLGLTSIRIEQEKSPEEMLSNLIDKFSTRKGSGNEKIDLVLIAHENDVDFTNSLLASKGLDNVPYIQLKGNQCSNIEQAMILADSLLMTNDSISNIMILTWSHEMSAQNRIINTYALTGDGAGIIVYSREDIKLKLVKNWSHQNNDPKYFNSNELQNEGLSNFTLVIQDFVNKFGIKVDKISLHNANVLLYKRWLFKRGFSSNLFFKDNEKKYGHLNTCDCIINLKDILTEYGEEDKIVLHVGSGSNGSLRGILFEIM